MELDSQEATHSSGKQTLSAVAATVAAMAICAFLLPALVTFDPGDWPSPNQYPHNTPVHNACGVVGAWLWWMGCGRDVPHSVKKAHFGDGADACAVAEFCLS